MFEKVRNLQVGKKALITTNNWFVAPNGRQYRAVFGTIIRVASAEETLGIKTNARSSNWYVEIGNTTVAGCQIHYGIRTDECNLGYASEFSTHDGIIKEYMRPSTIYNADEEEYV